MKVKLISREGNNIIPIGQTFHIHSAIVGNCALIEPIEGEGCYRTSTIQKVSVVGQSILIETRNTKYEFEVND